jgi:hypothetical protein
MWQVVLVILSSTPNNLLYIIYYWSIYMEDSGFALMSWTLMDDSSLIVLRSDSFLSLLVIILWTPGEWTTLKLVTFYHDLWPTVYQTMSVNN